jgi:hypothetical protein
MSAFSKSSSSLLSTLILAQLVSAHPHHGDGGDPEAPIDAILWLHILVQLVVWGGMFGVGMVLGITRYVRSRQRLHVCNSPFLDQNGMFRSRYVWYLVYLLVGSDIGASVCCISDDCSRLHLGTLAQGSVVLGISMCSLLLDFSILPNPSLSLQAHGTTANFILFPLLAQLILGIYLKLHIHEQSIRPWAVVLHGIIGKSWLILGWVQMLFGVIVIRGYCGVRIVYLFAWVVLTNCPTIISHRKKHLDNV